MTAPERIEPVLVAAYRADGEMLIARPCHVDMRGLLAVYEGSYTAEYVAAARLAEMTAERDLARQERDHARRDRDEAQEEAGAILARLREVEAERDRALRVARLLLRRHTPEHGTGPMNAREMTADEVAGKASHWSFAGQHTVWLDVQDWAEIRDVLRAALSTPTNEETDQC